MSCRDSLTKGSTRLPLASTAGARQEEQSNKKIVKREEKVVREFVQ